MVDAFHCGTPVQLTLCAAAFVEMNSKSNVASQASFSGRSLMLNLPKR
jgi:hypothetical protein